MAVVHPQDDGGGARGVVDQGQLPEVIALVQSAHHTLCAAQHVVRLVSNAAAAQRGVVSVVLLCVEKYPLFHR